MAERTAVNVGEPADERPVDAGPSPRPNVGKFIEAGDQEKVTHHQDSFSHKPEGFIEKYDKLYQDLDSVNRSEFQIGVHNFYDDEESDSRQNSVTDSDWNNKSAKNSNSQLIQSDTCLKMLPLIGAASYEYFSLKIMNPSWFLRAFYGVDQRVSNLLWLQSHVGIGFYIYSRQHLRNLPWSRRVLYSVFGSALFNYGSCLFWAVAKMYLPRMNTLRVGFGLLTGAILLLVGKDYLETVDIMCYDPID